MTREDDEALSHFDTISDIRAFSHSRLDALHSRLASTFGEEASFAVVTCGSYGRLEASRQSDCDYFVIVDRQSGTSPPGYPHLQEIQQAINEVVGIEPSAGGAFATIHDVQDMLTNIGGTAESNHALTRRMLFLLEARAIYNAKLVDRARTSVLERYIHNEIAADNLARFLLNDLIRYYRTICVDFEYKTVEEGKAWAIRNIKLQFSRKLLYFSGVIAVAETEGLDAAQKRKRLAELLALSPLLRLHQVCGSHVDEALAEYDHFLGRLMRDDVRQTLNDPEVGPGSQNTEYRELKDRGEHFSHALERSLEQTYRPDSRIRHALLF